jgi:hypothetical protein
VETWIHGAEEIRPWCELIAEVVGYSFDDLDWDAVTAGMANADRHQDRWFEYSITGPTDTIQLRMAYNINEDNVSVIWEAPPHLHSLIRQVTSIVQRYHLVPR